MPTISEEKYNTLASSLNFSIITSYKTANFKLKIKHNTCGTILYMSPNSFISKKEKCKFCRDKIFLEKLEQTFRNSHKNLYNYNMNSYSGMLNNMEMICEKHGVFNQSPVNHSQGKGCKYCNIDDGFGVQMTILDFITKCSEVHNNLYDYSESVYTRAIDPINIICSKHGLYTQKQAQYHLSGSGCPICGIKKSIFNDGDYYKDQKLILYYVLIDGCQWKIGVTLARHYKNHKETIRKRFRKDFEKMKILDYLIFDDGEIGFNLEQKIISRYRNKLILKENRIISSGHTETFYEDVLNGKIVTD